MKADSARAEIRLTLGILRSDVAEQAREQGFVDRAIARRIDRRRQPRFPFPTLVRDLARELRMHIAPFGEPQVRDEASATRVDQAAMREAFRKLAPKEFPQCEKRWKIGALVAEQE